MVAVNTIDGIKYGFRLLGYLLAVTLLGGIVAAVGALLAENSPVIGVVLALAGFAIIYAGGLGVLYKVIADGVMAGNIAATRGGQPVGGHGGQPPAGQGSPQQAQGQQPRQQQQARGQQTSGQQARGQSHSGR